MAGVKLIVDEEAVRTKYSLADKEDINTAIGSGLNSAHTFFAAILGTVFEEKMDCKDVFFLDDDLFPSLPNDQFRLRLKQAFVKPGSVTIKFGTTRKEALATSPAPVEVAADDFYVDEERGLVYLDLTSSGGESFAKKFAVVTYAAGFGSNSGVKAPEWLKEAVLAWMGSVFLFASAEDPSKVVTNAKEIQRQAGDMVDSHKRESAFNLSPIY